MDIPPVDPAPKKRGRPPRDPNDWTAAYLTHYALKGNHYTAARLAGVDPKTARKHRRASPDFARAVKAAHREFIASLEERLVDLGIEKGNVIAILARLKASGRKPAERYSEKAVDARVLNLTLNQTNNVVSETAAKELLRSAWAQMTDATRAQLGLPPAEPAILEGEVEGRATPGETEAT